MSLREVSNNNKKATGRQNFLCKGCDKQFGGSLKTSLQYILKRRKMLNIKPRQKTPNQKLCSFVNQKDERVWGLMSMRNEGITRHRKTASKFN